MTEERDASVSAAYRGLGAEEPPRALDEAILAASRLPQAKPWTKRWAVPLALAAVLVLSVTVTLRIQQEQPGIEAPAPREMKEVARAPVAAPAPAAAPEAKAQPKSEPPPKPAPRREPVPFQPPQPAQDQAAVAAASAPALAPAPASAGVSAEMRSAPAARMRTMAESADSLAAKSSAESPERELERIAQLRRDGRHEEADKALAEFRKRLPDYRIPAALLERIERR